MTPDILPIGTLIRTFDINEQRIAFLHNAGLECIQLAGAYDEWLAGQKGKEDSDAVFNLLDKYNLPVVSLFLSYKNQWSTPGGYGLTPANMRTERMLQSCRQMLWAKRRGIASIVCHVGLFNELAEQDYERFILDMQQLLDFAAENGQNFLFETSAESTEAMLKIFNDLDRTNLGINFDPANLLITDNDSPDFFLEHLKQFVQVVHCKDANRPVNGEKHGRETPLGKGGTQFAKQLKTLMDAGFTGPLIIERELKPGPEQEKDVAEAIQFLKELRENR